jgi:hypothetical protein
MHGSSRTRGLGTRGPVRWGNLRSGRSARRSAAVVRAGGGSAARQPWAWNVSVVGEWALEGPRKVPRYRWERLDRQWCKRLLAAGDASFSCETRQWVVAGEGGEWEALK